jgi:low temperature requirement protein LtrA
LAAIVSAVHCAVPIRIEFTMRAGNPFAIRSWLTAAMSCAGVTGPEGATWVVLVVALAVQVTVGERTVRVLVGVLTMVAVRVAIGNVAVRVGLTVVATRVIVRVEVVVLVVMAVVPAGKVCVTVRVDRVGDGVIIVLVLVPVPVKLRVITPEGNMSGVLIKG